jgi:hypothetical protein
LPRSFVAAAKSAYDELVADLPARQGVEIFDRANDLLRQLPTTIGSLGRWDRDPLAAGVDTPRSWPLRTDADAVVRDGWPTR